MLLVLVGQPLEKLMLFEQEILIHHPQKSDFAPSDYDLFPFLQKLPQ